MSDQQHVAHRDPPSERDLSIYERLLVQGHSLDEMAQQTGLSPQQVNSIADDVAKWVLLAQRLEDQDVTWSLHIQRLEHQWRESMDAWRKSRANQETLKATIEEGAKDRRRREKTQRSSKGDIRFLWHALKVLRELLAFKALARERRSTVHEQDDAFDVERTGVREISAEVRKSGTAHGTAAPPDKPGSPPSLPES